MTDEIIQGALLEIEGIDPERIEKLNQAFGTLIESLTILNGMVRLATQRMQAFADLSDVQFPEAMGEPHGRFLRGETIEESLMRVPGPESGPDYVLERHLKAPAMEG